jgi:peptidyl-prolyl cis-trans isomerase D
MSLFGVTGYINSAGSNRTVIKVDNVETTQAQFSHQAQKEMAEAKKLLGEDYEMTEEMQTALIYEQVQKIVQDSVLDRMAQKYHVSFRPEVLQTIILNQSSLRDSAGRFDKDAFRRMLSEKGLTEGEYVAGIKRDLTRRLLSDLPVAGFRVPEPVMTAFSQLDNKRRTFTYVMIDPANVSVNRQITPEETEQYYDDFKTNFIEPERRDVTVLYLTVSDIAARLPIDEEDVRAYYNEHKDEYETPQKRQILQMMFQSQDEAEAAYNDLKNGADFYDVAEARASQTRDDTELGYAAQDELVDALGEAVFHLYNGEYTEPVQVGDVWQIMKVTDIQEGSVVPYKDASAEIIEKLKEDNLYDQISETTAEIEDRLAAGVDLETVARELKTDLFTVKGVAEDATATFAAPQVRSLADSQDFLDTVFSYALNETSQVVETDEGLAVVRVDRIEASHPKEMADVRGEINDLWLQNEKTAIVQEMLNDVNHDLENGDTLAQVAQRYGLDVYHSQPITRNETFADIDYAQIHDIFAEPLNTPQQIQKGDVYLIAVADHDYKNSVALTDAEKNLVRFHAYRSLLRDFSSAMLSSYARDYKIRVKYKLLGLED